MLQIDAVLHQVSVRVHPRLVGPQLLRRADHHVRLEQQASLQLADLLCRRVAEGAELVDAVIDDQGFAESARDGRRAGQEAPGDRGLEPEMLHRPLDLRLEQRSVRGADQLAAVEGNGERRQHPDVGMPLTKPLHRAGHLFQHPLRVAHRDRRAAVADAVHPKHAVLRGENLHRVHLGERIPVPVVGEADDVATPKCSHPRFHLSLRRLDRGRRRAARADLEPLAPQLEHPERIQLFLAVALAALVIVEQTPDRLVAEPRAGQRVRGQQGIAQRTVELPPEPVRDRDREPALARSGTLRRQPVARGLPQ